MMRLNDLRPAPGARTARKRVGRGIGSGLGKTSGRGHKGQHARSGGLRKLGFEGGQMPLQRRVPKFGFKNRNRVEYAAINLGRLSRLLEEGRLAEGDAVTPETLVTLGLTDKRDRVKILGDGDFSAKLDVSAHAFSASARSKIEAAGGSVNVVE